MQPIDVLHYDAFTTVPGKGNPAGVVLDASHLTADQMQEIAHRVGFSETAFVVPSDVADLRLRFFTPGFEIDLCGHATMGSFAALVDNGRIAAGSHRMETLAGVLPIGLETGKERPAIRMQQATARFEPFDGSVVDLASALGIETADIDDALTIVYGSTGNWTLVVPVKTLDAIRRMVPQNARFPEILTAMPRASLHPFCRETYDPAADMHARHFASPCSGLVEDPVTGTASGVLGAYHVRYMDDGRRRLLVEQGHEMNKDGRVEVHMETQGTDIDVAIVGTAVYAKTMQM